MRLHGGWADTAVWILSASLLSGACGGGAKEPARGPSEAMPPPGPAIDFAFDSLDERPVRADTMRGKPTVLAFVTTSSLPAQAQVDYLVAMAKHDGDRVNYAVVAIEPPEQRELVELYRKSLGISFPVATIRPEAAHEGGSPFGDLSEMPVTVLLDSMGRVAWRVSGRVAKSDEIRAAMRGL